MCHNGVVQNRDDDDDVKDEKALQRKWYLVIKQLMSYNFNVALINEIEWRDTKVCCTPLNYDIGVIHVTDIKLFEGDN